MLDYYDYNIDGNGYQGNGNGYDRLVGDWGLFYKVAKGFKRKVKPEDREDFQHDLMLEMGKVKAKYELTGKPLTEAGLMRVASYQVSEYWRDYYKRVNGIRCDNCSKRQRQECREKELYSKCPKAIRIESYDRLVEDGNGDSTALHELIVDDNAVDIVAMLDAKFTLNGYPRQALLIAYKRYAGYPLDAREQRYLNRFRRRLQKTLL
jgi:hypothetical protein